MFAGILRIQGTGWRSIWSSHEGQNMRPGPRKRRVSCLNTFPCARSLRSVRTDNMRSCESLSVSAPLIGHIECCVRARRLTSTSSGEQGTGHTQCTRRRPSHSVMVHVQNTSALFCDAGTSPSDWLRIVRVCRMAPSPENSKTQCAHWSKVIWRCCPLVVSVLYCLRMKCNI